MSQIQNNPPSTKQNSKCWKVWHNINYLIGGSTFLLGSIVQFSIFANICNTAAVSGWLYTVGSFGFLLADLTQWIHYEKKMVCLEKRFCIYQMFSLNFLLSAFGSLFYLIGSICFIPIVNKNPEGQIYFILGSGVIVIAQSWKIIRGINENDKTALETIKEDFSGFFVDLFAGLGALFYYIGTLVMMKYDIDKSAVTMNWYISLYCFGGFFFLSSGIYVFKRYFIDTSYSSIQKSEQP